MIIRTRPIALVCLVIFLMISNITSVLAGPEDYRQCSNTETCEIGEFLYDDDYIPVTTATCTLSSKDPQGNNFLNNAVMTSNSDGWYSYEVVTDTAELGLYRSQICCDITTEHICLDKSFEIVSPAAALSLSDEQIADAVWDAPQADHAGAGSFGEGTQNTSTLTADDVWSSPQRSLTNFGSLIDDIWGYSSRSLNNVSSIVSGVWSSSDRSINNNYINGEEIATKSQIDQIALQGTSKEDIQNFNDQYAQISQQLKNNRYFLELLVNEPIVETFIEEGSENGSTPGSGSSSSFGAANLQSKIKATKRIARDLSIDIDGLNNNIADLSTDWDDTDYQIALAQVSTVSRVLGANTNAQTEPDNINSRIAWLSKKWKNPIISNLSVQTTSALANVSGIDREIKSYGKTFISQQYLDIAGQHLENLGELVGSNSDGKSNSSLYGYIAFLENIYEILVEQSIAIDELAKNWNEYSDVEKDLRLFRIKEKVLSVNQIEDAADVLKAKKGDEKHRENLLIALRGLIEANLVYLSQDSDQVSQVTWLEHGSVVFKSLITNPSDIIAQNVKINYYLPKEIHSEHIMSVDDNLEVKFDTEKDVSYVSGEVYLDPEETKSVIVEVVDVWVIPDEDISSIKKQTETLFNSLKGTSYFAQGATIKADIEVNLDKIAILQEKNQTPELKIKSHREAMLELNSARSKLESLKIIVASAGSIDTVFGFVGGVQVIAVWGLIIILIAGFVSLLIYLKMIVKSNDLQANSNDDNSDKLNSDEEDNTGEKPKNDKPKTLPIILTESSSKTKSSKKTKDIKEKEANVKEASTFTLIKNIIAMKLYSGDGGPDSKKIIAASIALIFMASSAVILTVFSLTNMRSNNIVSPVPESYTGNTAISNDPEPKPDQQLVEEQESASDRAVLGVDIAEDEVEDEVEPEDDIKDETVLDESTENTTP